jgi:hypothetical protein
VIQSLGIFSQRLAYTLTGVLLYYALKRCYMDRVTAIRLLGLSADFDELALKKAYRSTAKRVHPDIGGSQKDFMEVKSAYEKLLPLVGTNITGGFTHEAILIIRRR